MDLGPAQPPVGTPAHCLDGYAMCWPGAFLPMVVPLACLPLRLRAQALNGSSEALLGTRVAAYLDAQEPDAAWQLLAHCTDPLTVPPGVDNALQLWGAKTLADMGLVAGRTAVLVIASSQTSSDEGHRLQTEATQALLAVQGVLATAAWPRWIGQVLVVVGSQAIAGLPATTSLLIRPALPAVRIPEQALRGTIARRLCVLALALNAPPATGWPAWLSIGLAEISAARADDVLVSPHAMLLVRQAAGTTGLEAMLSSGSPDPQLCLAMAALLVHPARRANLPSLMDLLRNGATSQGALQISYSLSLEDLVTQSR
jgi:hypothetical protein